MFESSCFEILNNHVMSVTKLKTNFKISKQNRGKNENYAQPIRVAHSRQHRLWPYTLRK